MLDKATYERERLRPQRSPLMYQKWHDLAFFNAEIDPDLVQTTLPPGLKVDTFLNPANSKEMAWISFVPFRMSGIRPRFCPPIAGLSSMLETNLRTYVFDEHGRPGVWFYTLETDSKLAYGIARKFFHLNYNLAKISLERGQEGCTYSGDRIGSQELLGAGKSPQVINDKPKYSCQTLPEDHAQAATFGSLAYFLLERYRLFAFQNNQLFSGRVWHTPYQFFEAKSAKADEDYSPNYGFKDLNYNYNPFVKQVKVEIFRLEKESLN